MNTPATRKANQETIQTPIFDPFPKPQTMPSGWDLSGLDSTSSLSTVTEADTPAEN